MFTSASRVLRTGGLVYLCELHPYRQLRGGQAHFTDASGDTVPVPAVVHTVSEYVNGALAAGFTLLHLGEWLEDGAPDGAVPRLLSVRLSKRN